MEWREEDNLEKKEKLQLKNPEIAYFIKVISLMKMRGDLSKYKYQGKEWGQNKYGWDRNSEVLWQ